MTTLQMLVDDTKRHLSAGQRDPMDKLSSGVDAITDELVFTYGVPAIQAGNYLQVDLEVFYVWAWDSGTKTATVARGQQGSTAATHDAGAIVTVNPRFTTHSIVKAINDDLLDLATPVNGLYAVRALELTGSAATSGYDLTGATNLLEVISISASHPGQVRSWHPVTNYDVAHNAETDDFASGYALRLHEGVSPGRQLRVLYKASFSPLNALTDDVELVAGLPASMHDLPPLGAAMRLVAPREVSRSDPSAQGDSRRAGEVPPGSITGSLRGIATLRSSRIAAEAGRLAQQYPERGFLPPQVVGYW